MDAAQRELLADLFERALALPLEQRPAFLEDACRNNAELYSELISLLAAHEEAPDWLEAQAKVVLPAALADISEQLPCDPSVGSRVSHYEILEELGGGGMGLVYKARDLALDRLVALKFLPAHLSTDGEAQERLKSEARAVSALDHPNIAVVHEIAQTDPPPGRQQEVRLFIVMAHYGGETIKQKIARGPLPFRMALDFASQVADGLSNAHAAGIVHRDIKPANLIVTERGRVMIVDFGLAKTITSELTTETIPLGTAAYMSPEQIRGGPVDHRTDIWSLGVTLYEMLTGRRPFRAASDGTLASAIRDHEPEPVEHLRTDVAPALADVIRRCLAKEPAERYQSCEDLLAALQHVHSIEAPVRRSVWLRSWPKPVWLYVVTLGLIGFILLGSFYRLRRLKEPDGATSASDSAFTAPPQLAVLPFINLRADAETDFLGYALADQIIGQLGYVRGLVARPSSAVSRYQGKITDPMEVAKELHVQYVLTGSYVRDGAMLRLNVELVQAPMNEAVWRDNIQLPYGSLLSLQDRVAEQVSRKLAFGFTREEQVRMQKDATAHPLAYHYYLRALGQPIGTEEGLRSGRELLVRSLELDASFASAHAAFGFRSYMLANQGYVTGEPRSRMLSEADEALQKALGLNAELLSGLSYQALLYLETGRIEEALDSTQRALAINPNSSEASSSLGHIYRFAGMFNESERAFARAKVLIPYNSGMVTFGLTYLYSGKYDQAEDYFALGEPGAPFPLLWQGMTFLAKNQPEEARQRFAAVLATRDTSPARWVAEAHLAYMAGNLDQGLAAVRALEQTFAPAGEGGEALYHYGRLYTLLGDAAAGIAMLDRAIDQGFFPYPYLRADPFLDRARDEPDFNRVLAKAEARHQAFKRRLPHGR